MTQGVQDNRDFYRIQDRAILEFTKIDPQMLEANQIDFHMPISPEFYLLNELHGIDNETSALLRSISERERSIASYLKSLNHKIELIAQTIVQKSSDLEELTPQEVTLSEGGISFTYKKSIPLATCLAVKLVLLPSYIGLLLLGRVVNCNEHISGNFLINLVFERLAESDRQLIARHVLQFQAKERRSNQDQEPTEK